MVAASPSAAASWLGRLTSLGRFGIAAVAGGVLMAGLGVAVAMSYHPVRPRILCAMPLGTGEVAVYFGYSNETDEVVVEPLGPDNHITPGGSPVTTFEPGSSGNYPRAAFVVNASPRAEIAWTVGPRTVRYDADETLRCPIKPLPKEQQDVTWVPPKPVEPPPPPKIEPPPPPPPKEEKPKEEPPPPPKVERPTPVKPRQTPPKAAPETPMPLVIAGLSNDMVGGMALTGGEETVLGDAKVEPTPENVKPRETGVEGGVPGGTGTEPVREPKRVAAKVKVRPKGEWPADAPPRAGSVLVRLSLLVGVDGTVRQVKVVRGAGPSFDREAKAVGARAVFSPATVDGEPVETWVPWDVEFTPDDF